MIRSPGTARSISRAHQPPSQQHGSGFAFEISGIYFWQQSYYHKKYLFPDGSPLPKAMGMCWQETKARATSWNKGASEVAQFSETHPLAALPHLTCQLQAWLSQRERRGQKGNALACPETTTPFNIRKDRHKLPLTAELRLTSPLRLTSFSSLIMPCTGAAIKTWLHPFTLVSLWPFGQHEIRDMPHFLTVSDWDICWPPLAIHTLMLAPKPQKLTIVGDSF